MNIKGSIYTMYNTSVNVWMYGQVILWPPDPFNGRSPPVKVKRTTQGNDNISGLREEGRDDGGTISIRRAGGLMRKGSLTKNKGRG